MMMACSMKIHSTVTWLMPIGLGSVATRLVPCWLYVGTTLKWAMCIAVNECSH